MLAALLALAASFTWGTSNYLAGVETRTRSVWHVAALSQIAAAAAAAFGLVAATQPPPGGWDLFLLVVTGIVTAAGLVMFYKALAIGTMSVVAPIIAAQVLIPVAAGILLGERPGPHAYVGMVVTVAGVLLVVLGAPRRRATASPARRWSSPSSRPSPGASCCSSTAPPARRTRCGPCSTRG